MNLMSFKYIRSNVTKRDRMKFTLFNEGPGIMIRQLDKHILFNNATMSEDICARMTCIFIAHLK